VDRVEPGADLGAFEIVGEDLIAASGKDEDGRSRCVASGLVDGDGGFADVGQLDDAAAGDEGVGREVDVFLRAEAGCGLGCAV